MTRAVLETLLDDAAFSDGRVEALLGAARGTREIVARAQEHAHRLLEQMLWCSDGSGRIVLPGSTAETRASTESPHFRALRAIATAAAANHGVLRRTAAAVRDPGPGWAGLAHALAAFHDDLEEAAAAFEPAAPPAAWPVRPMEDEGPYLAAGREPVLALAGAARAQGDLFEQVFVHGSLATLDERPGVSDLDIGVVLSRAVARDPDALLAAQRVTGSWWRHLQDVDLLQHHGAFAYTAADLAFYPETFLPFAVLAQARSISGNMAGRSVCARPTDLARGLTLLRAAAFLRNPAPASLFALKMYLQSVLLAPVFALQAGGTFVYKRDAFGPFEERADALSARAVSLASRARAEDWYADDLAGVAEMRLRLRDDGIDPLHEAAIVQRALDRAVTGRLVLARTPAAAVDRAALAALLLRALPAALEPPPFAVASAGPPRREPARPHVGDRWLDTARAFVEALGDPALVTSAWALGSRGNESGSDLDLALVVDPARAAHFDWSRLHATWAGLSARDREVMIHPPSAILSPARARGLGLLFPVFRCEALWGEAPDPASWRCSSPEQALALLSDYALAQYPGEFLDFLDAETLPTAEALGRVGAIRHALALATLAGVTTDPATAELARSALALRAAGADDPGEVRPLLERAVVAAQQIVDAIARRVRAIGFERPESVGPLAGLVGDRILLMSAHAPDLVCEAIRRQRSRLGSCPVNAVPLELAWGLLAGIAYDAGVNEIFGGFVDLVAPLRLPPAPPAWRARWRAVAAHAAELRGWGCAGGYLHPNHLHLEPERLYAGAC